MVEHLYPNKEEKRPIHFKGKPVIFLSARVHCGETPASFFLQGIYDFLMTHKAGKAVENGSIQATKE